MAGAMGQDKPRGNDKVTREMGQSASTEDLPFFFAEMWKREYLTALLRHMQL